MNATIRQAGVTLVELLIVLALATILLGATVPSFHQTLQRLRLQAAANDLLTSIDLTRSQAMARGGKVLMTPSDPGGTDWRLGWMVFQDANGNRRPDPGEPLIYRHGPLPKDFHIESRFSSGGIPLYVAYNASGRVCSASNSLVARWGTLSLMQGEHIRNIKINMLGRVRVCDPARDSSNCGGAAD